MDLSMRGLKEMREELNADLLRRIAYLTKGQLMGEILFYIFLLSSIVYLIVGKVYKSIVCIKKFREKKSIWILPFILLGIAGLVWNTYGCPVKAASMLENEDTAGNHAISDETGKEGAESEEFITDNSAPKLTVNYEGVWNIMDKDSAIWNINETLHNNEGKVTSSQNQIFCGKENGISICIEEDNIVPEDIEIKLYRMSYGRKGQWEQEEVSESDINKKIIRLKENQQPQGIFFYAIKNLEDGHYRVKIHCTDKAGNVMEAERNSETDKCIDDGWYESPIYTVDTVSPIITEVFCDQYPVRKKEDRQYFKNAPEIIIRIQEENFNKANFSVDGKMFYADGKNMEKEWRTLKEQAGHLQWKSYYKDGIRINEARMKAAIEANYTILFQSTDGAVHKGNQKELKITYDAKKPEIIYTGQNNQKEQLVFRPEIQKEGKSFFTFRRYPFFRYFSIKRICASIQVRDEVSGVENLNYMFVPYGSDDGREEWSVLKNEGEKQNLSELTTIVLPAQQNFKGYLKVYGQDYSGNVGEIVKSKGMVSEDEQLHEQVSKISLKIPEAVFTDEKEKLNYYNKAVFVEAVFEDEQSGICKTSLCGKVNNKEMHEDSSIVVWDAEDTVYRKRQRLTLEEKSFRYSDSDHPIMIQGSMTDNAGHVSEEVLEQGIIIDTEKPVIKVEYDRNNQTEYYNTERKARVIVKERNFRPELVKWDIKGSNQEYHMGEWKTTEDIHTYEIYFDKDGEDYAINLSVTDRAGNKSEWKDREYFTIDKTLPEVSIAIENNTDYEKENQLLYFKTDKTVVFCIKDKNFDEHKVEYDIRAIKAANKRKQIDAHNTESYVRNGEKHYKYLTLKEEAHYYIQMRCTDKAGNVSEKKKIEFIIDKTVPNITIKGVKNEAVYEDRVIMPEVICEDKYLDADSVKVYLLKASGEPVSKEDWNYERTEDKRKVQIQWENLRQNKSKDGIYQLFIKANDKAGNKIKDNYKVVFRVNRWGADFILNHKIKESIDGHYLREEPNIILKERCVKQTKSRVIILKDNEERRTLQGEYVKECIIADKKSEKYGWYEKSYNIKKENFAEEGEYLVTIQEDSKEKKIHFVIDKTPPAVHISNLEKDIYEEEEHNFTIGIMDNYAFERMELYVEKSTIPLHKKKVQKFIIKPEDLDKNHMVNQKITEDTAYQTIHYIAWDKAGNKLDSNDNGDTRKCLVTTNKPVKEYYKNNPRSQIIMGIVIAATVFTSGCIAFYNRKKHR